MQNLSHIEEHAKLRTIDHYIYGEVIDSYRVGVYHTPVYARYDIANAIHSAEWLLLSAWHNICLATMQRVGYEGVEYDTAFTNFLNFQTDLSTNYGYSVIAFYGREDGPFDRRRDRISYVVSRDIVTVEEMQRVRATPKNKHVYRI